MSDHRKLSNSSFRDLLNSIFTTGSGRAEEFGLTEELIDEAKSRGGVINTKITKQVTTKAAAKAATTDLNLQRKSDNEFVSGLKIAMRAARVPADKFVAMGFDADDLTVSSIAVQSPADLSVKGVSNGINTLKFNRNGNKQGTIFLIEAKIGDAAEWTIVATTTKTGFEHKGQKPGVKVLYRVRAQRGEEISEPSNEAVVYE